MPGPAIRARVARAALKRELAELRPAASRERCAALLLGEIADELAGIRLGELLRACQGIGDLNARVFAEVAEASVATRLRELTGEQRTLIAGALKLKRVPGSPGRWV